MWWTMLKDKLATERLEEQRSNPSSFSTQKTQPERPLRSQSLVLFLFIHKIFMQQLLTKMSSCLTAQSDLI